MTTITGVRVHDVRFPTSLDADGSDAMNKDGDYSAAYVVLRPTASLGSRLHVHDRPWERPRARSRAPARQPLVGRDVDACSTTLAASTANWHPTPSCAGSGRRRASCIWRWPP